MKPRLIVLLCIVYLSGCRKGESPEKTAPVVGTGSSSRAPVNAANQKSSTLVPIDRPRLVDSVVLSEHLGAGGFADMDSNRIPAGSPIYMSMILSQCPAGSAARAVWRDATGKVLGDERRPLATGAKNVTFVAPNGPKWKPGKYLVESWMGGDESGQKHFEIIKAKKK